MKNILILQKKEVEDMIKVVTKKQQKEFYEQLSKLRSKIIDLEQLIKLNIFGKNISKEKSIEELKEDVTKIN